MRVRIKCLVCFSVQGLIFNCNVPDGLICSQLVQGNIDVYPDMAAYHSIAVTLGQAGLLKELLNIVECMKQKPKTFKFKYSKNWDPIIEPDIVIYNAVRKQLDI